jgi:hypothetical protein
VSEDDSQERRYSDEEFALILRKASELQARGPDGAESGVRVDGLTLEEMRSIAAEAGMDPDTVTRAASLLGALEWDEKAGRAATIFGGQEKYNIEFELPVRLPPEELGTTLAEVRRIWEHQGKVTEELGGFQWKTVGELSAITVNITPRGDSTAIQIVGNRGGAAGVTYVFPLMASAILLGALGATFEPTSVGGIVALVSGTVGAGFLTARTLWASSTSRFKKKLNRLTEALSSSLERVVLSHGSGEGKVGPAGPSAGVGDGSGPGRDD